MELQVRIQSPDSYTIAKGLFGSESLEPGKTKKDVTDGVTLRFDGVAKQYSASVGSPAIIFLEIAITLGKNVMLPIVVGILSSYIYDKLKEQKAESIKIGNTYIKANNVQINQQIIYQTIINEASQQKKEDTKT